VVSSIIHLSTARLALTVASLAAAVALLAAASAHAGEGSEPVAATSATEASPAGEVEAEPVAATSPEPAPTEPTEAPDATVSETTTGPGDIAANAVSSSAPPKPPSSARSLIPEVAQSPEGLAPPVRVDTDVAVPPSVRSDGSVPSPESVAKLVNGGETRPARKISQVVERTTRIEDLGGALARLQRTVGEGSESVFGLLGAPSAAVPATLARQPNPTPLTSPASLRSPAGDLARGRQALTGSGLHLQNPANVGDFDSRRFVAFDSRHRAPASSASWAAGDWPALAGERSQSLAPGNSLTPSDGSIPSPVPSQSAASGSGGSSFVPIAALLALLALVAPATCRRFKGRPVLAAPAPFVCALERPG